MATPSLKCRRKTAVNLQFYISQKSQNEEEIDFLDFNKRFKQTKAEFYKCLGRSKLISDKSLDLHMELGTLRIVCI